MSAVAQAAARNVISGNSQCGVLVTGSGTIGNTLRYDFIGTDVTGEHPVSNGFDGVILQNGVSDTYVDNNLISANANDGVLVFGSTTNTNYLEYNSIGLDATGLKAVKQAGESYSNLTGVEIDGATSTLGRVQLHLGEQHWHLRRGRRDRATGSWTTTSAPASTG